MEQQQLSAFGPLAHPVRHILLGLHDHPMGGRELLSFLEAGKCWVEPGTLWAMLSRLERAGLISPLSTDGSWHQIRRYQVTNAGDLLLSEAWRPLIGASERIGPRPSRGFLQGWIMILIKWIVRLYPKAWRERYEQEMIDLLGAHKITFWTCLDLLWNALDARLDPFYQRSTPLSPFRRLRRGQKVMLAAFILPLLSALSYAIFFSIGSLLFIGGLSEDYWIRNEHYPILALTHELGSLGMTVTWFCPLLIFLVLANGGIKRFGRPAGALLHRLILVAMCLPLCLLFAIALLVSFFPFLQDMQQAVGNTVFGGSFLLICLLLIGWGWLRREVFTRALPYLLPWLGFNLFTLTGALGQLTPDNQGVTIFGTTPFYMPIALLCLLSTPISFVVAMLRLRLGKQLRSSLLLVATVETLGMTLVQLMMAMRLITLYFLQLSTIWSTELIVALVLNVLSTALALAFVLTLLLLRRRKAPPTRSTVHPQGVRLRGQDGPVFG